MKSTPVVASPVAAHKTVLSYLLTEEILRAILLARRDTKERLHGFWVAGLNTRSPQSQRNVQKYCWLSVHQ